jgi:hypothetical protein
MNLATENRHKTTWPITLKIELRLRVTENEALRRIFGANRVKITAEW